MGREWRCFFPVDAADIIEELGVRTSRTEVREDVYIAVNEEYGLKVRNASSRMGGSLELKIRTDASDDVETWEKEHLGRCKVKKAVKQVQSEGYDDVAEILEARGVITVSVTKSRRNFMHGGAIVEQTDCVCEWDGHSATYRTVAVEGAGKDGILATMAELPLPTNAPGFVVCGYPEFVCLLVDGELDTDDGDAGPAEPAE